MNELHEEFESKGLTIIGVTSESESNTEPWIDSKGATYPYAYDKGGKLKRALGVSGIPHAFLVSPGGTIVWEGHPGNLKASTIEANLEGAISKPLYEWSGGAKKAKQAFLKNDFAGALAAAAKLAKDDPFGTEVEGVLKSILASRVQKIEGALRLGDILTAYEGAKVLSKGLKGLPEEETIKAALKRISKEKDLKATLKVQEKLRDITSEEVTKKKEADANTDKLEKLLKGNEGTFVGNAIETKIKDYRKMRGSLR